MPLGQKMLSEHIRNRVYEKEVVKDGISQKLI